MTTEDKELLLKDLCSRLPYGVKVKFKVNDVKAIEEKFVYVVDGEYSYITDGKSCLTLDIIKLLSNNYLDDIKPYLFPLSSMTEEQRKEWLSLMIKDSYGILCPTIESFDYLYKNHIDVRGFIDMGLANDATGLNIY